MEAPQLKKRDTLLYNIHPGPFDPYVHIYIILNGFALSGIDPTSTFSTTFIHTNPIHSQPNFVFNQTTYEAMSLGICDLQLYITITFESSRGLRFRISFQQVTPFDIFQMICGLVWKGLGPEYLQKGSMSGPQLVFFRFST